MKKEQFDQKDRVTVSFKRLDTVANIYAEKTDKEKRQIRIVFDVDSGDNMVREHHPNLTVTYLNQNPAIDKRKKEEAERIVKIIRKEFDGLKQKLGRFFLRQPKLVEISPLRIDNAKGATTAILTITVTPEANYDRIYEQMMILLQDRKQAEVYAFEAQEKGSKSEKLTEEDADIIEMMPKEDDENKIAIQPSDASSAAKKILGKHLGRPLSQRQDDKNLGSGLRDDDEQSQGVGR